MKALLAKIRKILRNRRTRQAFTRFVSVNAAIVVFVTTYALVLPAITMEIVASCGIEAHQHDDSCYEEVLTCGLPESAEHTHDASCYEKVLVCGKEEHIHSVECYNVKASSAGEGIFSDASAFGATEAAGSAWSADANADLSLDESANVNADLTLNASANADADLSLGAAASANTDADSSGDSDTSVNTDEQADANVPETETDESKTYAAGADGGGTNSFEINTSAAGDTGPELTDPGDTGEGEELLLSDPDKPENEENAESAEAAWTASGSDSDAAAEAEAWQETELYSPAVSFEESIRVSAGRLPTDTANTDPDQSGESTEITVHVEADEGTFPEGAAMVLSAVEDMDAVAEAVEGVVDAPKTRGFHAVDISFRDAVGNEIEPLKPIRVNMISDAIRRAVEDASTAPVVVHLEEPDTDTADTANIANADLLPSDTGEEAGDADLTFESGAFSVYAIVYTVDFHYEVDGKIYDFSIPGGGAVSFYNLIEILGIAVNDPNTETDEIQELVNDVESIGFSSPELVSVSKAEEDTTAGAVKERLGLECQYSADLTEEQIEEINAQEIMAGDWALISLKPFETEESLTVSMKNGEQWTVKVTDAAGTELQSTDEIIQGSSYLIYTVSGTQYRVLKPDGGYYDVPNNNLSAVPASYYWTFDTYNGAWRIHSGNTYIPVRSTNSSKVTTTSATSSGIVAYNGYNSGFKIYSSSNGVNYYIGYDSSGFKISTSDGCRLRLYGQANKKFTFTCRTEDTARGLVSGKLADGTEVKLVESFQSATKDKGSDGTANLNYYVEATPKPGYLFQAWSLNGKIVSTEPRLNADNTAGMFSANNQTLMAIFKEDPSYHQGDVTDPATGITISPDEREDLDKWLESLDQRDPLQNVGKTARAYDYQNRIYEVDITAESAVRDFYDNIDLGFILDASGSMKFPSSLIKVEGQRFPLTQENLNAAFPAGGRYYIISDPNNTSTVYEIYANSGYYGNWQWTWQDASYIDENDNAARKAIDGTQTFADVISGLPYQIYRDEYEGQANQKRVNYLNSSLTSAVDALVNIVSHPEDGQLDTSSDVYVAYNTFFYQVNSHEDFQSLKENPNISVQVGKIDGGTSQDIALDDARTFSWGATHNVYQKYAIMITDGAAVYNSARPKFQEYTTSSAIQGNVRTQADLLKGDGIKLITIGLSTKNVDGGSNLLKEIASDIDGERQFYEAEKGEDLKYILLKILQTIMSQGTVSGYVEDEIDPAFYPVDKTTGKPLAEGDLVNLNGELTTDRTSPYGTVVREENGNWKVVWSDQTFGWKDRNEDWNGKLYIKSKEDFLGGNVISTNGDAKVVAESITIGDTISDLDDKTFQIGERETPLSTPYVNVNELKLPSVDTVWTVYDGTNVAPKEQLKGLLEQVSFREAVTENGELVYGNPTGSLSQERPEVNDPENDPAAELSLREALGLTTEEAYSAWYDSLLHSGSIEVPYYGNLAYGHGTNQAPVGKIKAVVTKSGDTSDYDEHAAETGKTEEYKVVITYEPTEEATAVAAISEIDTSQEDPYHNGAGTRGAVTDALTSQNTHTIYVYDVPLDVLKTNAENKLLPGAVFTLYKADAENGREVSGLPGKVTEVSTGTSGTDGLIRLPAEGGLKQGAIYYLREETAPPDYVKSDTVWLVQLQTENGTYTDLTGETIYEKQYPFNWDQGARILVDGVAVTVITKGDTDGTTETITDGSYISHQNAISFRHPVVNSADEKINVSVRKIWENESTPPESVSFELYRVSEKGHTWGGWTIVPSTCTEDGVKEHTCTECGKTETIVLSKDGHTPGTAHRENEVAATCTSKGGYDTVVRCTVCNAVISSVHTETPVIDHIWGDPTEEEAQGGQYCYDTVVRCTMCGVEKEGTREHHDHEWGEWQVTTPATKTNGGVETRVCAHNSEHQETRATDKLPEDTTITYRGYRACYGLGWLENTVTTSDTYPVGSLITLTWSSSSRYDAAVYVNSTPGLTERSYISGSYKNGYDFSGGTKLYATRTETSWWEGLFLRKNYEYSVTVTVTEGMTLDLVATIWDEYPRNITITKNDSGPAAAGNQLMSKKLSSRALLSALPAAPAETGAGTAMSSAELSEYLDGLKSKNEASCAEEEGTDHIYKESAGTYTITAGEDSSWTLAVNNLPKYNEYGNEYTYYVVETSPVEGYEVTYLGQDDGLKDGSTAVIHNEKELKGELTVTKSVPAEDAKATYKIAVKNKETGHYFDIDGTDKGTTAFYKEFSKDQSMTWSELKAGTYVVEEENADAAGYTWEVSGTGEVEVSAGGSAAATVINSYTKNPGSLCLSKIVTGAGADSSRQFEFTVALTAPSGETLAESYAASHSGDSAVTKAAVADGKVTGIRLRDGETYTISGLPVGTGYVITEADYSAEGYTMSATSGTSLSGTIEGGTAVNTAEVTNAYSAVDIAVLKVDENTRGKADQKALEGAVFKLYKYTVPEGGSAGTYTVYPDADSCEKSTAEDGSLSYEKLPNGRYMMEETNPPAGYVKEQAVKIYFTISEGSTATWTNEAGEPVSSQNLVSGFTPGDPTFTVGNTPGAALPASGGPGTGRICLFGIVITAFAAAGLVIGRRRRKPA